MQAISWVVALTLLAAPAVAPKKPGGKAALTKAIALFEKKAFPKALKALDAATAAGDLSAADGTLAQAIRGAALLATGDAAGAKSSAAAVLEAEPDFDATRPSASAAFARFAAVLEDERKTRKEAKAAAEKAAAGRAAEAARAEEAKRAAAAAPAAAPAVAADGAAKPAGTKPEKKKKVAVMDSRAAGTLEPRVVSGLNGLVAAAAARTGVQVMSYDDITMILGFDRQRQILGCSDGACLAEIGGALGVDYLLTTEVADISGVLLLNQTVLDANKARAVERSTLRIEQAKDLAETVNTSTQAILRRVLGGPSEVTGLQQASAPALQSRAPGLVVGGVGLLAVGGGVACGLLAQAARTDAQKWNGVDRGRFDQGMSAAKTQALVADLLYGVGGAALVTGLILVIVAQPQPEATVTVAPAGTGVLVSGRF